MQGERLAGSRPAASSKERGGALPFHRRFAGAAFGTAARRSVRTALGRRRQEREAAHCGPLLRVTSEEWEGAYAADSERTAGRSGAMARSLSEVTESGSDRNELPNRIGAAAEGCQVQAAGAWLAWLAAYLRVDFHRARGQHPRAQGYARPFLAGDELGLFPSRAECVSSGY